MQLSLGDFNCRPAEGMSGHAIMPSELTFRKSPSHGWCTTTDGCVASPGLAAGSFADCLEVVETTQHCLVICAINTRPVAFHAFRWKHPSPNGQTAWDDASLAHLRALIASSSFGQAWSFWHDLSGGHAAPSSVERSCPWTAGWAVGVQKTELSCR